MFLRGFAEYALYYAALQQQLLFADKPEMLLSSAGQWSRTFCTCLSTIGFVAVYWMSRKSYTVHEIVFNIWRNLL